MKIRWNFRCYPTPRQEQHLAKIFGCTRYVYNWGIEHHSAAYVHGEHMNYARLCKALTLLKREPDRAWLNDVSSVALQQSLRNLQRAYKNFFAKRNRYPKFKKRGGRQSATYVGTAFKLDIQNKNLSFIRLGRMKVKWSRDVSVFPSSATIIRKPSGRYFVSLVVDIQPPPLPKTRTSVGIDFGVSRLATLSNGERIANPKYTYKYHRRMARIQRNLARKKKGSNRRRRCKRRLARLHEKIADCRKDTANKLARDLVERFDVICVEDLNLREMVKNHNLTRSLHDVGIGQCIRILESKAAMHGKE